MKHRLVLFIAVAVAALTATSSALAFDCMRVSSSAQGLQQSASNSGMWLYFDMTDGGNGAAGAQLPERLQHLQPWSNKAHRPSASESPQMSFFMVDHPSVHRLPTYSFNRSRPDRGNHNGPGVIAHNNPNDNVLSNGTGIEHFDDTVLPVLLAAAPGCLS